MVFDNELRRYVQSGGHEAPINFSKGTMLSAFSSLDNWWDARVTSFSSAMDSSTAPFTFTAGQKEKIVSLWFRNRAGRV